jgi:hypothetical protein
MSALYPVQRQLTMLATATQDDALLACQSIGPMPTSPSTPLTRPVSRP